MSGDPLICNHRFPLEWRQKRTPARWSRRRRNWQRLEVGKRIVAKDGTLTNWVLLSKPFRRQDRTGANAYAEMKCLGCGEVYVRRLGHVVQGKSRRCANCSRGRTKAGRAVVTNKAPLGPLGSR